MLCGSIDYIKCFFGKQMRNSFEGSLNSLISGNITVIMLAFAMLIYFASMTVSIYVYLRKDL